MILIFTLYNFKIENDIKNKNYESEYLTMIYREKDENIKTIYLAGGCFWGVEAYFSNLYGVIDAISGYANGADGDTDYHSINNTGHAETVKIDYDISKISLEEILLRYFQIIDPKSLNKQGNDAGTQYRTGVYYTNIEDKKIVEKVFLSIEEKIGNIVVENDYLKNFVKAEDYHQDYLEKNSGGYCHIDLSMANEPIFNESYKNPSDDELKATFDELTYDVLRNAATERPGTSKLNDEHRKGIYVDIASGSPLFSSVDKFDSGCGWPSFSKPILTDKIDYTEDNSLGMKRIEVRSSLGDNHLGHIFEDGPIEKGGLRYCINGAALEFIPVEEMKARGYEEYIIFCE